MRDNLRSPPPDASGGATPARVLVCDARHAPADVAVVDALARLCLTAHQVGCSFRVEHASAQLRDLITFLGLSNVLLG